MSRPCVVGAGWVLHSVPGAEQLCLLASAVGLCPPSRSRVACVGAVLRTVGDASEVSLGCRFALGHRLWDPRLLPARYAGLCLQDVGGCDEGCRRRRGRNKRTPAVSSFHVFSLFSPFRYGSIFLVKNKPYMCHIYVFFLSVGHFVFSYLFYSCCYFPCDILIRGTSVKFQEAIS